MAEHRAFDMSRYQRIIGVEWGRVTGSFRVSRTNAISARVDPFDLTIWDEGRNFGHVFHSNDMDAKVTGDEVEIWRIVESKRYDAEDAIDDLKAAILAAAAVFPTPIPREDHA